jgi:protein-S-isoprenylcysteine O-methyltransferase Ste14
MLRVASKTVDILALAYAVVEFPVPIYWLILHPGIAFWRRVGYRSFWAALPVWVGTAVVLISLRHRLYAQRMARGPLTTVAGVALLAVAAAMEWSVHHSSFGFRKLAGLPEINPAHSGRGVTRTGIYSKLRHPRYTHLMLGFFAFALLTGAEGIFLLAIVSVLLYLIVAPLEEKELRNRYGAEYAAYAREVPRFFPRLGRKPGKSS